MKVKVGVFKVFWGDEIKIQVLNYHGIFKGVGVWSRRGKGQKRAKLIYVRTVLRD